MLVARARPSAAWPTGCGSVPRTPTRGPSTCSPAPRSTATSRPARWIDESAVLLAEGALALANLWDLDTLVLAGPGFAVAGSLYVTEIRRRLAQRAFARDVHDVQVDLSSNPRDSAAIGGAALVLQGSVAPGHGPLVSARH